MGLTEIPVSIQSFKTSNEIFFTDGQSSKWMVLVKQKPKLEDLVSNPFHVNDMQEICTTNQIGKNLVLGENIIFKEYHFIPGLGGFIPS